MLRVLNAGQMGEADRLTSEQCGVPGLILMENAGSHVTSLLAHRFAPLERQRIVILCGKGNNGGDGMVVARHVVSRHPGAHVETLLFAEPEELRGDAAANYRMLRGIGHTPLIVREPEDWAAERGRLSSATVLIDALLGTGLKGAARGLIGEAIADIRANFSHAPIVAVDIPSGLPSDSPEPLGHALPARYTVTFTAPKISQALPPNCDAMGELNIGQIGTPPSLVEGLAGERIYLLEGADFQPMFRPRGRSSHKGDYGHVLVIGGSRAKPGAVLMAGTAALRAGAGLVTVATSAGAAPAIVGHTPELMTEPAAEIEDGSMGESAFRAAWFERRNCVALGPGLGVREENRALVARVVRECEQSLVLDADALTAIAADAQPLQDNASPTVVLTPHPGEMSRLSGWSVEEIQKDRLRAAREYAETFGAYVTLKGYRTLIACPDGRVMVNPTGTPAMATGGSGDILTGLIAGLLAQFPGLDPALVISGAVYLHGLAGEKAAAQWGEKPMIATDLLAALPAAVWDLESAAR